MLDVWASIQMPKYPEQIARALQIPVTSLMFTLMSMSGSYGLEGHQANGYSFIPDKKLQRPVRFIEDRLENMAGGECMVLTESLTWRSPTTDKA